MIFVTGHGDVPMAVGAMRHGAFDFLQKPFREQDLLDRVQRALARDRESRLELHRAHVIDKMGAQSIAQLVRMVIDTQP